MALHVLVSIVLLSHLGLTFHVDDDCEAKSMWKWTSGGTFMVFGVWISEEDPRLMELSMTFAPDEDFYNDKIVVSKDGYNITRRRDQENPKQQKLFSESLDIKGGWASFKLITIDKYKLWYLSENGYRLMLEEDVDSRMTSVEIKGSNVTAYCPNNVRTWFVEESSLLSIPLEGPTTHLSLYSIYESIPSIKLGQSIIHLGMDNQSISTSNESSPLPPFKLHNITILCIAHEKICTIKVDEDERIIYSINQTEVPKSLTVKSQKNSFSIIVPIKNSTIITPKVSDCCVHTSLTMPIMWSEYLIGSWRSPQAEDLLFKITFANYDETTYFDRYFFKGKYFVYQRQRDTDSSFKNLSFPIEMREHWYEFQLITDESSYEIRIKDTNDESHVLDKQNVTDYKPVWLIIEGKSYFTLNCLTDDRHWHITDNSQVVPVGDFRSLQLTFYSNGNMTPSVTIGSRFISLRWNGGKIISYDNGYRLPPFFDHQISLTCTFDDPTVCTIEAEDGVFIDAVTLHAPLNNITIHKGQGDPFRLYLHKYVPKTSNRLAHDSGQDDKRGGETSPLPDLIGTNNCSHELKWTSSVIAFLIMIQIVTLSYFLLQKRQSEDELKKIRMMLQIDLTKS